MFWVWIPILMLYYYYFLFSKGTQTLAVHCRVQWQWCLHIIICQKSLRRPDRLRLLCEGNSVQRLSATFILQIAPCFDFITSLTVILDNTGLQLSRSVLPVLLWFNKPHYVSDLVFIVGHMKLLSNSLSGSLSFVNFVMFLLC